MEKSPWYKIDDTPKAAIVAIALVLVTIFLFNWYTGKKN